jgi:hypothetical protein
MLQSNIITPRLRYNIEIHHMVYVNYCASTTNSHIDLLDIVIVCILHRLVIIQVMNFIMHIMIILKTTCKGNMSNNMHTLNFDATSNIQHFHTSAAKQVHVPMNNYQGQTSMVSLANFIRHHVLIILN